MTNQQRTEIYHKTIRGLMTQIYSGQRQATKKRNHPLPSYSKKELIQWITLQPHFENLFLKWEDSEYSKELKPSIDRLDDYKSYTLQNIQLGTWKENNDRGNDDMKKGINKKQLKAVIQYDKNNNQLNEFHSMSEAERQTGCNQSNISGVCHGKYKQTGGFIWRFKGGIT